MPSVLRLSPEYGGALPLWPQWDHPERLIPRELFVKLMAWQELFDSNFDSETGWRSEDAKTRWAAEAIGMETELRDALAGKAEVVVDLWPLKSRGT